MCRRIVLGGRRLCLLYMPGGLVFPGERLLLPDVRCRLFLACECEWLHQLQPGPVLPCRLRHQCCMRCRLLLPQRFSAAADPCWILLWRRRHRPNCLPALLFSCYTPYALCSWLHGRRQPVQQLLLWLVRLPRPELHVVPPEPVVRGWCSQSVPAVHEFSCEFHAAEPVPVQRRLRRQRLCGHDLAVRVLLGLLLLPRWQREYLLRVSLQFDVTSWLVEHHPVYVPAWLFWE